MAKLYDSAGNDTFIATPHSAKLYGSGFYNRAVSFRYVHAYAAAGDADVARLYDSPGDDTFVATPHDAKHAPSRGRDGAGVVRRRPGVKHLHSGHLAGRVEADDGEPLGVRPRVAVAGHHHHGGRSGRHR